MKQETFQDVTRLGTVFKYAATRAEEKLKDPALENRTLWERESQEFGKLALAIGYNTPADADGLVQGRLNMAQYFCDIFAKKHANTNPARAEIFQTYSDRIADILNLGFKP